MVAASPAPAEPEAIADVVVAAGQLLDRCRPIEAGVSVQGWIDPPNGDAPPMSAKCSITLQRQGPFLVAQVLVLIPPDLKDVHVAQPYERITWPERSGETAEAIAWDFVATADGAVPVASTTVATTRPANVMAPVWDWTGTRWEGPGRSRCGGGLTAGGGTGGGASIEFVSVCPP